MNQSRVFLLVNLSLLAASGALLYYLANVSYEKPTEIDRAMGLLAETEFRAEAGSVLPDPAIEDPNQIASVDFMGALIKLTPTPTPTPAPTPMPVRIDDMIDSWLIKSMDAASVTILDRRSNEEFDMSIGGGGKQVSLQNQTIEVKLCGIDLDKNPFEAKFCDDRGQSMIKRFE